MRSVFPTGAAVTTMLAALAATGCNDDAYCFSCDPSVDQPSEDASTPEAEAGPDVLTETGSEAEASSCPAGYADCNGADFDGCEINVNTDKKNCGQCGHACSLANAQSECVAGACAIAECKSGFEDCDGDPENGCEAEIAQDPNHCGGCDQPCAPVPNATPLCELGECKSFKCNEDLLDPPDDNVKWADCNGDPIDGCEIDLLTDIEHCGVCQRICDALPFATPGCVAGSCGVGTCEIGTDDCDLSVWSGCETILESDVNHCGNCGQACPDVPNGAGACVDSTCVVGSCNAGYDDCDGLANGCEAYLATDVVNCGACGNQCPAIDHGTPGCSHFQCGVGSCEAGWGDCSGGATDGCETHLDDDPNHCGTCSTTCSAVTNGQRGCLGGQCVIDTCNLGFDDCNGQIADGCETTLLTDTNHCGLCNHVCPSYQNAVAGCSLGVCALASCEPGFSNCDNDPANGCEKNTLDDPNNCGGCEVKCGTGQTCVNSQCTCSTNVLMIIDDSASGAAVLETALEATGLTVTATTVPSHQYDGTNPAPTGFGSVVLLAGGPGASASTDMPAAGQQAILDFVNTGVNGLVLSEWAALHVQQGRWQTLKPLVLLVRPPLGGAYTGQATYNVEQAFQGHPLWAGLNSSFSVNTTSNYGPYVKGPGIKVVASSPQAYDVVAIRDLPSVGRVVHVAHAGNYVANGWTNANMQRLVANAVRWSAHCP